MILKCAGYDVQRRPHQPATINADFILMVSHPHKNEEIAEAMKNIELYLSGEISLVKADSSTQRCFYCASGNPLGISHCTQCGAVL